MLVARVVNGDDQRLTRLDKACRCGSCALRYRKVVLYSAFLILPIACCPLAGASEHDLLVRVVEMLGMPPAWLLAEAKHTDKYFRLVRPGTGNNADGATGHARGMASSASAAAAASGAMLGSSLGPDLSLLSASIPRGGGFVPPPSAVRSGGTGGTQGPQYVLMSQVRGGGRMVSGSHVCFVRQCVDIVFVCVAPCSPAPGPGSVALRSSCCKSAVLAVLVTALRLFSGLPNGHGPCVHLYASYSPMTFHMWQCMQEVVNLAS